MGNSDSMEPYTGNDDEFVPMAVVAKKWNYDEYHLIDWSVKNEFDLYYPYPNLSTRYDPPKTWFLIGRLARYFLNGRTNITVPHGALCVRVHPFGTSSSSLQCETDDLPADPDDYMLRPAHLPGCPPDVKVTIDIRDLYLHRSEIAAMEKKHPELSLEVLDAKTGSAPEPKETTTTTEPSKIKEESAPNSNDEASAPLLNKEDAESVASSTSDVIVVAPGKKQLPLSIEIENNNSNTLAEKPKSSRQPKKLKQKTDLPLTGGSVEPQASEADKSAPLKERTVHESRFVRLEEIIGNSKKGITAMYPVSRSSWLAGVKSGDCPPPVKLGKRSVGWKLSDINILIALREKGETWADHIARTTKSETSPS